MGIIEDSELRDLFKAESEEHLERLDEGLLRLEEQGEDPVVLKELFREAHSLKGAARMLGVAPVETVAHCFEDLLGSASRQEIQITPDMMQRMVQGLHALRLLVREAVTGDKADISIAELLAMLKGEGSAFLSDDHKTSPTVFPKKPDYSAPYSTHPTDVTSEIVVSSKKHPPETGEAVTTQATTQIIASVAVEPPSTTLPAPTMTATLTKPHVIPALLPKDTETIVQPTVVTQEKTLPILPAKPVSSPKQDEESILNRNEGLATEADKNRSSVAPTAETIRIDARKLDTLMAQAGEIVVSKNRLRRRLFEIEEMQSLLEDCPGGKEKPCLDLLATRLNQLRQATFEDDATLELVARELEEGIRNLRLLPLANLFNFFPRMVRDMAKEARKEINLLLEGGDVTADKRIVEEMKDPLMHLIRNAIFHGIEDSQTRKQTGKSEIGVVRLVAERTPTSIVITVEDDGKGLDHDSILAMARKRGLLHEKDIERIKPEELEEFIFASGFSTSPMVTDIAGRGVGLDVVRNNVEHRLKGQIRVSSQPGLGCRFIMKLPLSLTTSRVFLFTVRQRKFALPVEAVFLIRRISHKEAFSMEGGETVLLNQEPISLISLADILELPAETTTDVMRSKKGLSHKSEFIPCIVIAVGGQKLGLLVDELLDEQEVVLKPHSALVHRVRNLSGATILGNGEVCMVLHPPDLIKSVQKKGGSIKPLAATQAEQAVERKHVILLVEDSITTRTQEKRILEGAGYQVVIAVDGLDALKQLGSGTFDAVVSDVQMPNMDGLVLTEKIRQHKTLHDLPIILVTSLASEEDRKRGLEVGANAYITKPTFDQTVFLDTVRRLAY